jgi:tetratricopeptide (TPR) repeat protein
LALNKRKVLEAARKHAQKGAKAKALKEYNKLLSADPRDAKLLLEVGDAYRRWGQASEAIAQYSKVAQQYRQDGFDARAVAVFKQILNLDPKHYAAYVALSELYQRMGLDSDAIAALQTAADGYHKEGRKPEALELLRQMAALDPSNTTSRMKVAELLRQEGMDSEALTEYRAVAEELERQGTRDQLATVQERILEIDPNELPTLVSLVRNLMVDSKFDRAETLATHALGISEDPAQYELLIDLYAHMGDDAKLAETTRGLAKHYRDRGDEEKARELMQRLPAEDVMLGSRLAVDVSEVEEPLLDDDEELLEDDPFETFGGQNETAMPELEGSPVADLGGQFEREAETLAAADETAPQKSEVPIPEGDPDQLLAEASVYLRYGKREQAIASLRGVLVQDPNHRGALEKLGEAYVEEGRHAEAVEVWSQAAVQVRAAGDASAFDVLHDRIAALDAAAAARLGSVGPKSAPAEEPVDFDLELEVEVDLDLDDAIEEVASSDTQSGLDFGAEDAAATDEFEFELDDDSDDFEEVRVDPSASGGVDESRGVDQADEEIAVEFGGDGGEAEEETFDFEFDDVVDVPDGVAVDGESALEAGSPDTTDEAEVAFEIEFDSTGEEAPPSADSASARSETLSTITRMSEELEEAEFYLAQSMYDEAEGILRRILEASPNHPGAMLRLGEIEASRGASPDGVAESAAEASQDTAFSAESVIEASLAQESSIEALVDVDGDGLVPEESDEDAEIAFEVDLDDETEETDAETDLGIVVEEEVLEAADEVVEEAADESARDAETASAEPVDAGETFDLREALADVLADEEEPTPGPETSGVLSTVGDGFESIFSDFKRGVSATLEEGDHDTRYDLGIAYREMGLFEDAIGEFRVCLDSDARRFDSLYLMGLCARDLSRFGEAVNHLEQALSLPDIPSERMAGVYFDLSLAQEGAGDRDRACASLRQVIEIDADFPGAAERLSALEHGESPSADVGDPGEGYESFDDLFQEEAADESGDEAIAEAVPAEAYESLDDVLEEAESVITLAEEAAEPIDQPSAEITQPVVEDTTQPGDTRCRRKSGRKKISFV